MAAKIASKMHLHCHSATFYRVSRIFFLGFFAILLLHGFDAAAEGGKGANFPPEADYPEEAYEAEPEDADSQETEERYKQQRNVARPQSGERASISDDRPYTPARWAFAVEIGAGLNQITSEADSERATAGVKDGIGFNGQFQMFRNAWGLEFDGKYSYSPIQLIDTDTGPQNRAVTSDSLLFNLAYKWGLNGPAGRFHLNWRAGYGLMGVTQEIETTAGITLHKAKAQAFFLGLGLEARWVRSFSSTVDFYQSVLGSGELTPTNAIETSGYGFWALRVGNRVRLENWGERVTLGVGVIFALQGLKTPVPPATDKAGGNESFLQLLGTAYLTF